MNKVAGKAGIFLFSGFIAAGFLSAFPPSAAAGEVREITLTTIGEAEKSIWSPQTIHAKKGDTLKIRLINESEMMHGFSIKKFKVKVQVFGENEKVITVKAKKSGKFKFFCHFHKKHKPGKLIVE